MVSGQLWKLNSETLINKAKLWQANESHIWKFLTQRDDSNYFMIEKSLIFGNVTKKAILEALHDDKVKAIETIALDKVNEQKLSGSESKAPPTPHQLWRKGEGENNNEENKRDNMIRIIRKEEETNNKEKEKEEKREQNQEQQ